MRSGQGDIFKVQSKKRPDGWNIIPEGKQKERIQRFIPTAGKTTMPMFTATEVQARNRFLGIILKKKFHPNKLSFRHLSKLSCPNGSRTCNDSFRDARQEDYIRKVQELGPDHSSIQELGNKVKQQRRLRQQQSQGVTLCKKPNGDQGADSDVLCNTWLQLRTLYTQHWTGQGNFTRAAALSALMNQRQGRNELTVNTEDSKEIS